ncbi:MAG: division/cell wall cluster transcriptional repressor MraZ [Deltaproteobacteria bacterium]|nr:division/cell wall cluster transcriptional repressor MraZ [Deltaproteobacteria bacterium]
MSAIPISWVWWAEFMPENGERLLGGRFTMSMDAKGRLALPASLREQLGDALDRPLWITNGDRCLEIYPHDEWEAFVRRVQAMPPKAQLTREIMIYYVSAAQPITLDKAGRILVPPSLREEAGLRGEVVVVGMSQTIEIYNAEVFRQVFSRSRENFAANISGMSEPLK